MGLLLWIRLLCGCCGVVVVDKVVVWLLRGCCGVVVVVWLLWGGCCGHGCSGVVVVAWLLCGCCVMWFLYVFFSKLLIHVPLFHGTVPSCKLRVACCCTYVCL